MNPGSLAYFAVASILLAFTPGPDIITVIVRSVTQGTRAGLVAAMGFATGLIFHTTLAALGIAALLKTSPNAMVILRFLGVAYLLYLAVRIALDKSVINLDPAEPRRLRSLGAVYAQSILMNILNPKVTLFFLGFLPAFIDPRAAPPAILQIIFLGCIFASCTLLCFGTCAVFAGNISGWLRGKPSAAQWLRLATVLLFAAIAIWIAAG